MATHKRVVVCIGLLALCAASAAFADQPSYMDTQIGVATNSLNAATKLFEESATSISQGLVKTALRTCLIALTLQWILTYWKELFSGDLTANLAKAVGLFSWGGAAFYLISHTDILSTGFTGYIKLAGSLAGLTVDDFNAGQVLAMGKKMITSVHGAVWDASGTSIAQIALMITASINLIVVDLIIIVSFGILALTLFVANLEFWMMFAVAPLAFGLIPLSAFRDQSMAPIKGALSLGLRLIILGVCVAVAKTQAASAISAITTEGIKTGDTPILAIYDYMAGIFGCAIMSISAGKIASAIASGSASFSGSDAVRAGMTAAAGVGIAGAVGSVVAKPFTSALGTATSSAKRGLSAVKDAVANFGSTGVQQAGGAAGAGGRKAASVGNSFGGPAIEPRPSPSGESAETGGASSGAAPSSSPEPSSSSAQSTTAGDASTASIGGSSPNQPAASRTGSSFGNIRSAAGRLADLSAQDSHAVSVQMQVSKD